MNIRRVILLAGFGLALTFSVGYSAQVESRPVAVRQDAAGFVLENGIITARVDKENGRLASLLLQGKELLGHGGGYWSFAGKVNMGSRFSTFLRVNPATNGGELAEVVCRWAVDEKNPSQNLAVDYRYALMRGGKAIYATAVFHHEPGQAAFGTGEGRFAMKLNPEVFDFMTIDANRRRVMPSGYDWDHGSPLNVKEARRLTTGVHKGEAEHKYDYAAVLAETPAYGWSSTKAKVGLWFINPSQEYIGGGPTKTELTGHRDVNPGGLPTLLNMWQGSHYGGTSVGAATGENWTKMVGPFLIYCNDGKDHTAMWRDALAQADKEKSAWPFAWASDANYPSAAERATLSGRLVLRDAFEPSAQMSNIWVGLTAPDYTPPPRPLGGQGAGRRWGTNGVVGNRVVPRWINAPTNSFPTNRVVLNFAESQRRNGFPAFIDWQRDAKFYQFWVRADAQGNFKIPNIRAGSYTLHAFADGVLGELTVTNISVAVSETKSLGELAWIPMRFGRTVWQIGVPNRAATEFKHGDDYWHWGLYFDYPKEFPNDVNFVIGKSDWRKDWNYVQPPRIGSHEVEVVSEEDEENGPQLPRGGLRNIKPSTWSISFAMTNVSAGKATLRLAFCGTHNGCNVSVMVNGKSVGETGILPATSTMQRDGIRAYWVEKAVSFDASLLKAGDNILQLSSHADTWSQGVMYDCVRLEIADAEQQP